MAKQRGQKLRFRRVKPPTIPFTPNAARVAALQAHAAAINRPLSRKEAAMQFGGDRK